MKEIPIRDLEEGFLFNSLRKPDFQRETASWTPQKVVDLVRTFLDGDLIPAVILWQSGKYVFVIDGAHRLSALMAWVHNDYGDGKRSLEFFENRIPEEQVRIADRARKLIKEDVGTYVEHVAASRNPGHSDAKVAARASKLGFLAIPVQWVPAGDDEQAEAAFFKINQAATPIDPTELRILKSRKAGNAVAARAIVRGGTGHKYWAGFTSEAKGSIATLGREIYSALYEPPLETPIKTLTYWGQS